MKEMEKWQAWGLSLSFSPRVQMGEEPSQRQPPNCVDSHGFETLPRYFCLVDTREMVSLAEPQFSPKGLLNQTLENLLSSPQF